MWFGGWCGSSLLLHATAPSPVVRDGPSPILIDFLSSYQAFLYPRESPEWKGCCPRSKRQLERLTANPWLLVWISLYCQPWHTVIYTLACVCRYVLSVIVDVVISDDLENIPVCSVETVAHMAPSDWSVQCCAVRATGCSYFSLCL